MDQQCDSSCVVWIVVAVHSEVVIFKQKKEKQGKKGKKKNEKLKKKCKSGKRRKTGAKCAVHKDENCFLSDPT